MHRVLADLRFALRRALKHPGFTSIAVLSLALGIGANTAIFTLVNAVLLRRPPVPHREQIAEIYQHQPSFAFAPFSYPDYLAFRDAYGSSFTRISGAQFAAVPRDLGDHVETLFTELVTGDYFPLLGLEPEAGRLLGPSDDVAEGAHPVVVLSDNYWHRAFGADPGVVGREIRLGGRAYTIVGVAPKSYMGTFPGIAPALFAPIKMINQLQPADHDQLQDHGNHSMFLKVRTAPGVTMAQVRAIAAAFTADMTKRAPKDWPGATSTVVVPETQVVANPMIDPIVKPAAATLMIVVALVLLVACANLASFLLAQARDRQREIAIRIALGASRASLLRQLLSESLMLALVGGVAGLALSRVALRVLLGANLPVPLPLTLNVAPDATVFAFALLAALVAALFIGLLPALQATRPNVVDTIKSENTGGPGQHRVSMRSVLVVGQLAVSLVLLVTAALFLRSLQARQNIDPGFGHAPAGMVWFTLPTDRYPGARRQLLLDDIEERVRRIPGVASVGVTDNMLLNTLGTQSRYVNVAGFQPPKGQNGFEIDDAAADAGFLDAAGLKLVRGRFIAAQDDSGKPNVAVINEAMANEFWRGEDPVGRTFTTDTQTYNVIGVIRTAKVRSLGEAPRPYFLSSFKQRFSANMMMVARTRGDAEATTAQMVAALHAADPSIMVMQARTLERHIAAMMLPARLGAIAFGLFAALALVLAVIGVYGVVSYAVARRAREVGIRMALGAEPGAVVRLLMREGVTLVIAGGALGVALAAVTTRLLQSLLTDVRAADPLTFVAAPLVLLGVGVLATFIPARQSTRSDPARVLRAE